MPTSTFMRKCTTSVLWRRSRGDMSPRNMERGTLINIDVANVSAYVHCARGTA